MNTWTCPGCGAELLDGIRFPGGYCFLCIEEQIDEAMDHHREDATTPFAIHGVWDHSQDLDPEVMNPALEQKGTLP